MLPWRQPLFFLLLVLSVLHFIRNVDYRVALIDAKADQPTSRWKRFHVSFLFLIAKISYLLQVCVGPGLQHFHAEFFTLAG